MFLRNSDAEERSPEFSSSFIKSALNYSSGIFTFDFTFYSFRYHDNLMITNINEDN